MKNTKLTIFLWNERDVMSIYMAHEKKAGRDAIIKGIQ